MVKEYPAPVEIGIEYRFSEDGEYAFYNALYSIENLYGINHVSPEQLLLGVLIEGSANQILMKQNISEEDVFTRLKSLIQPQKVAKRFEDKRRPTEKLTQRSHNVLSLAKQRMERQSREGISSEDILFGIYAEGHNHGFTILNDLNFQGE